MHKELVSIIIPCYNQAQYLEEAVESAVNQTYSNIEIIIVNDGSTDSSLDVANNLQKTCPEKIKIISQKNQGLSLTRNQGVSKALGKYIIPLDADDYLDKDMVTHCMNTLKKNNADIVYSGYELFGTINRKNYLKPFYKNIILYWNVCSATALYKKEVWQTIGGYKDNMHGGYEDWEFWINAYKHGFTFHHLNEILWFYRRKEESMVEDAKKKDIYLRAKIIMNHPELYTIDYRTKAIEAIKSTEKLPDLFFYYYKDNNTLAAENLLNTVSSYIQRNSIKDKQIIKINNEKIGLVNLNILESINSLFDLRKQMQVNIFLIYSNLRYEIEGLTREDIKAFSVKNGLIPSRGTIFPYVDKEVQENNDIQFIAQSRLFCYEQVMLTIERSEEIKKVKKTLDTILDNIQKLTTYSILRQPYKKYKAYKGMLKIYFKIRKTH